MKFLIIFSILLIACKPVVEVESGQRSIRVNGTVTDYYTYDVLDSIEISWAEGSIEKKVYSDEDGRFTIENMQSGNIRFSIHHTDYADIWYYATIDPSGNHQNGTIYNFDMPVKLIKSDQSIETKFIYYTNSVVQSYAGLIVECDLYQFPNDETDAIRTARSEFQQEKIIVTTDQDGKINLPNLPNHEMSLKSYSRLDADHVISYTSSIRRPNQFGKVIVLNVNDDKDYLYILNSNTTDANGNQVQDFDITANIVVEFDKAVDINIQTNTIRLFLSVGGAQVPMSFQWSESDHKLQIDPDVDLLENTNYYISISSNLQAVTGEKLYSNSYLYFKTAL